MQAKTTTAPRSYLTHEAAGVCRYAATTFRKEHSLNGHFKGVRPVKMPGGRLLWPADEIDALARGEYATAKGVSHE